MYSDLKNKLLQYKVQPPAEIWNRISATLDENLSLVLTEKLNRFEEMPPAEVWKKIHTGLNEAAKKPTQVVHFLTRYSRPLRYSGAVAAMIVVIVLTLLLIGKKTESDLATETITPTVVKRDTNTSTEKTSEEIITSVTMSLQRDNFEPSSSKARRTKQVYFESSFTLRPDFLPRIADGNTMVNSSSISSDKYMIYSDGDGNAVRLPKKIFNAFLCAVDNDDCKQRLKELKEKFASAAVTSDFTGILEILKSLQENQ